jgi:hypothetical protein
MITFFPSDLTNFIIFLKTPTEDVFAVISKDNIRTLRPHIDQEGFKARHAPAIVLDQNDFVRIKVGLQLKK